MREKKEQKTTKTSKGYEKLLQERLKRERRCSPYNVVSSVQNLTVFLDMCKALRLHYKIGENTVKCMIFLYDKWIKENDGMGLNELCLKVYGSSGARDVDSRTYEKCRQMINGLVALGLVEFICLRETIAGRLVRVFAPTVKMLKEFSLFFKRFSDTVVDISDVVEVKAVG